MGFALQLSLEKCIRKSVTSLLEVALANKAFSLSNFPLAGRKEQKR